MIIRILKPYGKWKVGDTPDVTTTLAAALCAVSVAEVDTDQTRRDYTPKPPAEEPQPMVVNNYFVAPEDVFEIEDEPVISNLKKR
jgi:hypothetical protein